MSTAQEPIRLGVRGKLIGLLVGTAFIALLLACTAFALYDRSSFTEARRSTLGVLVASVAQSAYGPTAFGDPESATVILKVLDAEPMAEAGAIYAANGKRLALWTRKGSLLQLPDTVAELPHLDGRMIRINRKIASSEQVTGRLHVAFDTRDIDARTRNFVQIAAAVLFAAGLLALLIASLAQRVFTRPISLLSAAAERVQANQDFDVRAERVSDDELGRLTDAFNSMLTMIQERDTELAAHRAGLEELVAVRTRELESRNDEMRLVLDNVSQGLLTLDREGIVGAERSAVFDRWFGPPEADRRFSEHLAGQVDGFEAIFDMCFEELVDGFLPLELNLSQLPAYVEASDARHFEVQYTPLHVDGEHFEKLLVVMSDVTARVERERSDAIQAQTMAIFEQISRDRLGFSDFLVESEQLVQRLTSDDPGEFTVVLRELHTLKGNSGLFGLDSVVRLVHAVETECIEGSQLPSPEHRHELQTAWKTLSDSARIFLGENRNEVAVSSDELAALQDAISSGVGRDLLSESVQRLLADPVEPKLERLAARARQLADRLNKAPLSVRVRASRVRALNDCTWLWQVLPHVVANCVDHGIPEKNNRQSNKTPELRLTAKEEEGKLIIEIQDNGQGVNFEMLRAKAQKAGLPSTTRNQLLACLFADGVSTRDVASEISGRGVGLAAVKAACDENNSTVTVSSSHGRGCLFRFEVPISPGKSRSRLGNSVSHAQKWSVPPARRKVSIRPSPIGPQASAPSPIERSERHETEPTSCVQNRADGKGASTSCQKARKIA